MENYKRLTPEEKLLHIIEKPDEAHKVGVNKKTSKTPLKFKKITLQGINKLMIALALAVSIMLVLFFIRDEEATEARFKNLKKEGLREEPFEISAVEKVRTSISTYLEETEENNPFQVLPEVKKQEFKEEVEKKIEFKLVGIIWSDEPQAIIEELAAIAFSNMREFAEWGPQGVTLIDSASLGKDASKCVSEVSEKPTSPATS